MLSAVLALLATHPGDVDFAREVRPLLSRNCFACHGPDEVHREADLRLDTQAGSRADLGGYAAVVPGDAEASELWQRVSSDFDPMPPEDSGKTLTAEERELLRRWIEGGGDYAEHWSFVPPSKPEPPVVERADWPRSPLDTFVLARMEERGLAPAPEADRYQLARRVSLDLTGLPPTPAEARAFAEDPRPDAYERLVDKLLASPAYGERWASVWLDLARYADSKGHGSDPLRQIWRYRDWVIAAFNDNVPFDRFTLEQMAGDLLPGATTETRLATAFHRNTMTNTEGGTDDEEFRVAAVKDRANTTAQVWLGLTMGCAQCHTHKYDPITHEEYYSFYGLFDQTADADRNDDSPLLDTPTAEQAAHIARLETQIDELVREEQRDRPELGLAQRTWETEQRELADRWHVLEPHTLRSHSGTRLVRLPDGSIRASGESPDRDVYRFEAPLPIDRITGIRIEALADDRLPRGGPGRSLENGNFVLSELRAEIRPLEAPEVVGRYVRITNHGPKQILSLAEVFVWGGRGIELAHGGTATQSSTDYGGAAERALDHVTDGDYFASQSVTHTETEDEPWWEVDLGFESWIRGVELWNRTDGRLQHRLSDFSVEVFDDERRLVWRAHQLEPPDPSASLTIGGPVALRLASATADFEQVDWEVAKAIDGDPATGWAIAPRQSTDHVAVFATDRALEGPHELRLSLVQEYGERHTLGRFRIAVTDAPPPVLALLPRRSRAP